MKKMIFLGLACVFALAPVAANAGIPGSYALDKKPLFAEINAKIAKMPKQQRGFAKMAIAMIKSMEMFMNLEAGGKASLNMKIAFFGRIRRKNGTGTWSLKGKIITLNITTPQKKRPPKKETIACEIKSATRLACVVLGKAKKQTLFFEKALTGPAPKKAEPAAAPKKAEPKKEKPAPKKAEPKKEKPALVPAPKKAEPKKVK